MRLDLGVLPDDGVGPEVIAQSVRVLRAVRQKLGHSFNFGEGLGGGVVIDPPGKALSYETLFMYGCRIC